MNFLEAKFEDFEPYKQAAEMWNLDFRLLSKGKFNASLSISTSEKFQVGRTKLNGKLQQVGLCPQGFVTIAIPANNENEFIWLNTKSTGQELLIFTDKGEIEGASFDDFDMFTISIEKEFLLQTIDSLGYKNAKKYFDGDEKRIPLIEPFLSNFHDKANNYLSNSKQNYKSGIVSTGNVDILRFDDLFLTILEFIEGYNHKQTNSSLRKREIALNKAVEYINSTIHQTITISELCDYSRVSERTLQYAFLDRFQVTPKEYIIATKMHSIKGKLLIGNIGEIKVSDLAVDFGFWHMGKFSADYKNKYGELPSATLKRSLMF